MREKAPCSREASTWDGVQKQGYQGEELERGLVQRGAGKRSAARCGAALYLQHQHGRWAAVVVRFVDTMVQGERADLAQRWISATRDGS